MKDEALDLALEALEELERCEPSYSKIWSLKDSARKAITVIKQARALDKKAENARELGLDYEPVLKDNSNYRFDPPFAEPDLIARLKHPENHYEFSDPKKANAVLMSLCQEAADALADIKQDLTPVQPVAWIFKPHRELLWPNEVERKNPLELNEYTPLYTTPPAQPAPIAFEVGLVEWVGNKLMATPKVTTTPPASWMEMVVANLVREGVNKHKARELAEHFYSLAQRQWVGLTDEDKLHIEIMGGKSDVMLAEMVEAKLKEKNT